MRKVGGIELMESAPVAQSILKLAIPMMLGSVAEMIYNMTDTFFIGQTGDPNMVAGISLAMPLFMVSQGIGNIFAVGASSYISRMLGAKNFDEAKRTNAVSFYVTFGLGALFTVLLIFLRTPILHLIGTSETTFPFASDYFTIISTFIAFGMLSVSLNGQIRSEGASSKAMKGMLIGIVANIILDPLFILFFNWGVAGAAWATIIGQILSVVYYVYYFVKGGSILSIHIKDFKPNTKMFGEVLKIGVPSAVTHIIMTIAVILTNIIAAAYGDHVVAGNGISMRITMICFTLIMAMAFGFQPFAGYNYGARNIKRLTSGLKITMIYTSALAVFFTIVFFFCGRFIITFFIRDEQTILVGSKILRAFLLGLPFLGIQMTLMITFQALGKAIQSTIINLGRQFIIYLPLLFFLNTKFGFNGFIYAQPVADIATTCISAVLSVSLIRSIHKIHENGFEQAKIVEEAAK
jgi:putative MATE family efflux protein